MKRSALLLAAAIAFPFCVEAQEPGPIRMGLVEAPKAVFQCNPGPWGDLEYYPVILEAPDHVVELFSAPSSRTSWFFPGKSLEEIQALFREAELAPEHEAAILDASLPLHPVPPYRMFPPLEVVEALTPRNREVIYRELRRWSENRFFHTPIIIESGNAISWFDGSRLSDQTVEKVGRLTYKIGTATAFSDVSAVMNSIGSDAEERAFLKALTRTRSMILRLRVSPTSDIEALKDYWSLGHKAKDVLPFFESVLQTPGVERVDAIHLLPPTPRKYLNTFPSLSLGIEGQFPGSFWTTMNFFRYRPLVDFDQVDFSLQWVSKFYVDAEKPYRYGDIIYLLDPETKQPFHACVFIADDIVYTKNGRSVISPFMLMKLGDLFSRYYAESTPTLQIWRPQET